MKFSKLLILLLLVVCVSNACVTQTTEVETAEIYDGDAKPTPTTPENTPETSGGAIETPTPTPFTGQEVVFKGENAKINIEKDFRTSIKNQKHPSIWFEYEDENGNIVKKEISDEIKEIIENKWKTLLIYFYHKKITENSNDLYEASYSDFMESINSRNKLEQLELSLPDNRKEFTRNEITKLLARQGKLAFERFDELSKHFNE